ncbi:sigma-70 family RNA polymerase sigma factor [Paenibacillus sp. DMB20]|uniref:sigma-70 family RNA polymerase sigma factor n=1 Tax=Paenibacillus sp. DMB20 TaxID=1642570 RepID=UPI0006278C0D|nr:sigma-70 family RNA polymerase sigma factor [Paenibacillus sp. DMB20]KKO54565.1 RNA polymerase sigma-70 factor [Paenibacillus sp. DMB20]
MRITEANVVQQIKKRNEKTIAFLIQTYGGLISAIIKRHVHYNQQEYEECLDDVLLAIWQHIDAFDEEKNTFKQWIAAIAKYRAIDYQRRIIKTQQKFISAEITDDMYRERPQSQQQDVAEMLAHLSSTDRTIFEKYYLEGVSTSEMAQQMNVKESWIHNKLSRGRKKLRQVVFSKNEV